MRIISGLYGGRRFDTPKNLQARPTTDFAKESLFNLLINRMDFEGTKCLDLFAGTGAISFELVSREVAQVVSIEKCKTQQDYIQKIHDTLQLGKEHLLLRSDVFRYLKTAPRNTFDFIFADPPYALPEIDKVPELVLQGGLLKEGGLFVMEHGKTNDFSQLPGFVELRVYGAVHFSFFTTPSSDEK